MADQWQGGLVGRAAAVASIESERDGARSPCEAAGVVREQEGPAVLGIETPADVLLAAASCSAENSRLKVDSSGMLTVSG